MWAGVYVGGRSRAGAPAPVYYLWQYYAGPQYSLNTPGWPQRMGRGGCGSYSDDILMFPD